MLGVGGKGGKCPPSWFHLKQGKTCSERASITILTLKRHQLQGAAPPDPHQGTLLPEPPSEGAAPWTPKISLPPSNNLPWRRPCSPLLKVTQTHNLQLLRWELCHRVPLTADYFCFFSDLQMQLGEMFATKYEDNIYQADKVIMDNITQVVCIGSFAMTGITSRDAGYYGQNFLKKLQKSWKSILSNSSVVHRKISSNQAMQNFLKSENSLKIGISLNQSGLGFPNRIPHPCYNNHFDLPSLSILIL